MVWFDVMAPIYRHFLIFTFLQVPLCYIENNKLKSLNFITAQFSLIIILNKTIKTDFFFPYENITLDITLGLGNLEKKKVLL